MFRVILVDDHTVVRHGIAKLIESAPELLLVGEAPGGSEALSLVRSRQVDLVVTDLDMPGGGLDFIARLREAQPSLRILVLSQHAERDFAVRALTAGAHGYLSKQTDAETLLLAMHRVASGRRYLSEEAQELLLDQLAAPDPAAPRHARLTARELEIMRLIARGRRVGEIATDLGISIKTVSTHRTRVLEKLRLTSNVDVALYAREHHLI